MGMIEFDSVQKLYEWVGSGTKNQHKATIKASNGTYLTCKCFLNSEDKYQISAGFYNPASGTWSYSGGTTFGDGVVVSEFSVTKLVASDDKFVYSVEYMSAGSKRTSSISPAFTINDTWLSGITFEVELYLEPILKIGAVDLSDYCNRDNFSVSKTGVWSSGFTTLTGNTLKAYLGDRYNISCNLTDVKDDVKRQIDSACSHQTVSITFGTVTASFSRPDVSFQLGYETTNGDMMWNVSISSVCELAPGGL